MIPEKIESPIVPITLNDVVRYFRLRCMDSMADCVEAAIPNEGMVEKMVDIAYDAWQLNLRICPRDCPQEGARRTERSKT